MKTLTLLLISVCAYAQTEGAPPPIPPPPAHVPHVKTFFEQLPAHPETQVDTLSAVDQIANLSPAEATALLPVILADIKSDVEAVSLSACTGLYSLSRRPDSTMLIRPHLAEVLALYPRPDSRFGATANYVLLNMNPRPTDVASRLASVVMSPAIPAPEKIDTLSVMLELDPQVPEGETAALHVLNLKGDDITEHTRAAAIMASLRAAPGPRNANGSQKVLDRIVSNLDDPTQPEGVHIASVQAIAILGKDKVDRYRNNLAKLATDPSPIVRRLAQDVLDGKDERCTTLQGRPVKPCN